MIDTTQVKNRRTLRFETLDQMLADARACAAAGRLKQLGNRSLGQALNHLAAWIEYPFVGYPPELSFPDEMKAGAAAAKQRLMDETMKPGERLPGIAAGTLAIDDVPTAVGLARLETAAARLAAGGPGDVLPLPDPYFGPVTHHEWTEINLRHAELHLGFFVPQ
ncbi:MAG: DUF1569 domain-containing protein [Phycisphaerales bacterium]|nr:DUF1569 domain-containing protein [Phycisphaerales bacterium]